MSTTLARTPEVEPAAPPLRPSAALLDAGLITRLGRGALPDVEMVGAPAGPAAPPRRRAVFRRAAPLAGARAPAGRPPLSARPTRPLPLPGSPAPTPRALRPAVPAPAAAMAVPAVALPDLAPWISARPAAVPAPALPEAPSPPRRRSLGAAGPRRRRRGLLPTALAVAGVAAIAAVAAAGLLSGSGETGASGAAPSGHSSLLVLAPTPTALREIPPHYLQLYMRIGSEMDIDWRFLAAIGAQESDHGRNPAADRVNRSGCVGPMQIGVGGQCGNFLETWGTDGDGDGRINPLDPADAIATAAHGLRDGKGAPGVGGPWSAYFHAACGYYGACSDVNADYAYEVMRRAVSYGLPPRD